MTSRANSGEVLAVFAKHYKKYRDFREVPMLERLILLIVGCEATPEKVDVVVSKLKSQFVDWNELRLARIDDTRSIIGEAGVSDPESRALRMREMLSKLFTERHMLDAEFLREEDREKRADFLSGLPGLDFAMVQALECSILVDKGLIEKGEFPLPTQIQRVGQRLGWLPKGKDLSVVKARKTLSDLCDNDAVNLTYALVRVAEDHCHPRNPACPSCPLHSVCPTGRRWGKEGLKGEGEEA